MVDLNKCGGEVLSSPGQDSGSMGIEQRLAGGLGRRPDALATVGGLGETPTSPEGCRPLPDSASGLGALVHRGIDAARVAGEMTAQGSSGLGRLVLAGAAVAVALSPGAKLWYFASKWNARNPR
jgi:hypothetical protein